MKVFTNKFSQNDVLRIEKYFSSFVSQTNTFYRFSFLVSYLQSDIIKNDLNHVKISVFTDINEGIEEEDAGANLYNARTGYFNSGKKKANDLLQKSKLQVQEAKKKAISKIFSKNFPFSYNLSLNKEQIKNGAILTNIEGLYDTVETLEEITSTNDSNFLTKTGPLVDRPINEKNYKNNALNLLTNYQIDPAEIINIYTSKNNGENIVANSAIHSIKQIGDYYFNDALDSLSKENFYYKKVKKKIFADKKFIRYAVDLPKSHCNKPLTVQFDVHQIDNPTPVFSIRKIFDAPTLITNARQLSQVPNLKIGGKNLKVAFNSEDINNVIIQKKSVSGRGDPSLFKGLLEKNINYSPATVYSGIDYKPENYVDIYRCYVGNSLYHVNSPFFKSIAHCNAFTIDTSALIVKSIGNAALVTVRNIPTFASKFRIKKRMLHTSNQKNTAVELNFIDFDFIQPNTDQQSIFDAEVQEDKVYEYTLEYLTSHGIVQSKSTVYRHANFSKNKIIKINISNQLRGIENNKHFFRFTINSTVETNELDKILGELTNSQLYSLFAEEIKNSTDELSKFLFFKVVRTNLKNGKIEEFNQISATNSAEFSDDFSSRTALGIDDLDPTNSYNYQVHGILKDIETVFKDRIKTVEINLGNNNSNNNSTLVPRTYSYRPYIWRQPYVLQTGHMYAEDTHGTIIGLSSDQNIGILQEYTLQGLNNFFGINNVDARRIDMEHVKISWQLTGTLDDYDHFILIKEVAKKKSFVGTLHNRDVILKLEKEDRGTLVYYVIGITKDFNILPAKRSNALTLSPEEFNAYLV
jgi:hypothetical protein